MSEANELDDLLERARGYVMTDAEREAQRQGYAKSAAIRGPRQAMPVETDQRRFTGGMTSEDNWERIRQAYDAGIAKRERERVLAEFEKHVATMRQEAAVLNGMNAAPHTAAALSQIAADLQTAIDKMRGEP